MRVEFLLVVDGVLRIVAAALDLLFLLIVTNGRKLSSSFCTIFFYFGRLAYNFLDAALNWT